MNNAYSEDALVEQPSIELMRDRLGWEHICAFEEAFGEAGTLGREDRAEVVLRPRLKAALERLNPPASEEAVFQTLEEVCRDRSSMSLAEANRELYGLLKDGFKATTLDAQGVPMDERIRIVDWNAPENNDFLLVNQLWVTGQMHTRRPDAVGFVNGIPLILFEFKKPSENLFHAFHDNLRDYKDTIPQLFWYNAVVFLSNGSDTKIGTLTSKWEHFSEWKRINDEGETGVVSLETALLGVCEKSRFLNLLENFVLYSEEEGGTIKLLARNHQFLGVNRAVAAVERLAAATTQTLSPVPSPNGRGGYRFSGLVKRARELRQNQTPAEEMFWELVRNRQFLHLKFRRQHQFGDYILDFYCHEASLAVELDGEIHDTQENRARDAKRDAYLKSQGLEVLRIKNSDFLSDPAFVLNGIAEKIRPGVGIDWGMDNMSPSPSGRGAGGEGKTLADLSRLGVFWHTQGSGKSYSMIFFAQMVLRRLPGNWSFVIVTDRTDLDGQIYTNFANCGILKQECQANSAVHLKQLLTEDHRYIFTLIQKFKTDKGEAYPRLSDRSNIIVITDEAHRSQYDTLALNMRNALPNAAFIGFTGTPLMAGEEKTREVFGDYVSIYDFKQSVDDGATVPLYYENRIPELELVNENLDDDLARLLEDAELDEAQEKKLEREFRREYHLITRDERLDKVAGDLVRHFMGRGYLGKAMVVSIDKITAVKMHDRVKRFWKRELDVLRLQLKEGSFLGNDDLKARIQYMEEMDMAVVVSQGQNEIDDFRQRGMDIRPHRERMLAEDLETAFKNPENPLRMVFVCAMWTTGFDVPSCSTIYLDKPMKNHTLMQTIARANRVFGDKVSGLIVDYAGIFRNLQKALAIYGHGQGGGEMPVADKEELVAALQKAVDETTTFLKGIGVSLKKIMKATGFEPIDRISDAADAILCGEATKKEFLTQVAFINRLFKAILPDARANAFAPVCNLLKEIRKKILDTSEPVDISQVVGEIEQLLDASISPKGYVIKDSPQKVDLSQIDFERLQQNFKRTRKGIQLQRLKSAIESTLAEMMAMNRTRIQLYDKYQAMIADYNNGSKNIEELFGELVRFAQALDEEQKRGMREGLTEEELAVFDLLTQPEPKLTPAQEKEVKRIAHDLLESLKREKLVIDWRKKQQSRASVKLCIEDTFDRLPEIYTAQLYQQKCEQVYQHIYDAYYGQQQSIYESTGGSCLGIS